MDQHRYTGSVSLGHSWPIWIVEFDDIAQMLYDRFLFQFDGATANKRFAERWQQQYGGVMFAGATLRIGPGWTPDFLEIGVESSSAKLQLRLVELEATDAVAREACRKYLPESSDGIVKAFSNYLDVVLARCKVSADPRIDSIQHLKQFLGTNPTLVVETAGSLHNSSDYLEVFPLIDQHSGDFPAVLHSSNSEAIPFLCENKRALSRKQVEVLWRVIRILHVVVAGKDHNDGSLDSASRRLRKQFDAALNGSVTIHPELTKLHSLDSKNGAHVDCDRIALELSELWSSYLEHVTPNLVRSWIDDFYAHALHAGKRQLVRTLFEQARTVVAHHASKDARVLVQTG
jgi:hypothetical protein